VFFRVFSLSVIDVPQRCAAVCAHGLWLMFVPSCVRICFSFSCFRCVVVAARKSTKSIESGDRKAILLCRCAQRTHLLRALVDEPASSHFSELCSGPVCFTRLFHERLTSPATRRFVALCISGFTSISRIAATLNLCAVPLPCASVSFIVGVRPVSVRVRTGTRRETTSARALRLVTVAAWCNHHSTFTMPRRT